MAGRRSDSADRRSPGFAHPVAIVLASVLAGVGVLSAALDGARGNDRTVVRGVVTLTDGAVIYAGTPPAAAAIDMSADAYCTDRHASAVLDQPVRVGANGGLADVLVHVTNAPSDRPAANDEVLLDQVGCLYTPAVVAARAGQTVTIRNSDQTLHNVRVTPQLNRGFNLGQPIRGMESKRSFSEEEIGIPVQCDIHGWMHASIHVLDHGFFALSAEDGSFELPDLPAGDYRVEAVHPTLGTSSQTITVTPGSTEALSFEFSG